MFDFCMKDKPKRFARIYLMVRFGYWTLPDGGGVVDIDVDFGLVRTTILRDWADV